MADIDPVLDNSDDELARELGLESDEDKPKPARERRSIPSGHNDDDEAESKKAKAKKARRARRKVMDDFIVDDDDSESEEDTQKKKKKAPSANIKPGFDMPDVDDVLKSIFGDSDDEKLGRFDDDEANFSDLSDVDEGVVPRTKTQVKKWATYYKKEMAAAKRGNKKGGRGRDSDGDVDDGNILPDGAKRRKRSAFDDDDDDSPHMPQERAKKGNGKTMSEEEIKLKCIDFVTRMEQAWTDDDQNNRMKRPALKKIAMLEETKQTLLREEWHEHLLNAGVLLMATKWLAPLPDRSLPSVSVRDGILRALGSFREVTKYQLKESKVGGIVKFLSQNDPEPSLRKVAADLTLQWSRAISSASDSWTALPEVDRARHASHVRLSSNAQRILSTQMAYGRKVQGSDAPSKKVLGPQFASQPIVSTMDYTVRPESKVDTSQLVKKSGGLRIFAKP